MKENQTQESSEREMIPNETNGDSTEVVPSGLHGQGGEVDVFGDNLETIGITDSFEAKKYKQLLEAQRPVTLTDKEYDGMTGRLSSSTQRVKMVDDNAIQLQALKLLSTMKGRFDKQREKNNIQKFYGKVFIVSQRPPQEEQGRVVTISVDQENIPEQLHPEWVGPGWS